MAVQVHGDVALDLQPLGDGDVIRQLHDIVRAGPDGGAEGVRRGGLCRRASQRQMEGRFLSDVIVRQRAAILQLLARKNEPLLVGRGAFLVLNFLLHSFNAVGGFHLQRDGLAGRRFDKKLHGARAHAQGKAQHQRRQNPEYSFLHRDPSMMKVYGASNRCTKGISPCQNLLFRQGFKAIFRLLDGLLDDACCHRV